MRHSIRAVESRRDRSPIANNDTRYAPYTGFVRDNGASSQECWYYRNANQCGRTTARVNGYGTCLGGTHTGAGRLVVVVAIVAVLVVIDLAVAVLPPHRTVPASGAVQRLVGEEGVGPEVGRQLRLHHLPWEHAKRIGTSLP